MKVASAMVHRPAEDALCGVCISRSWNVSGSVTSGEKRLRMIQYKVRGKKFGNDVTFGTFNTLYDAYKCIRLLGSGTSRKFEIQTIKTETYAKLTAKVAEIRMKEYEKEALRTQ